MAFDINEILPQMLNAARGEIKEGWNVSQQASNDFMQRRKERLELLAQLRIDEEITEEKFLSTLNDEKDLMEAELRAMAVITKATAQAAANAAIGVLEKAIATALKGIL